MTEEKTDDVSTGECGACRAVIPLDSDQCPECNISFSGISEDALGECGSCHGLVPLDSTKCTHCGTVFIADDVVDVLRNWLATTGITIPMLFQKFDTDGDGQIDSAELKTGLLSLNLADLPPSQVERLIETIDADGDGRLDLGELHATITGEALPSEDTATKNSDDTSEEGIDETKSEEESIGEEEEVEDSADEVESESEESDAEDEAEDEIEEESSESKDDEDDATEEEPEDDSEEVNLNEPEDAEEATSLIRRIADAMDEQGSSPNRFFSTLDKDADGGVDVSELTNALSELLGSEVSYDDVEDFLSEVDGDGDRNIDMIEFITALETLDDADDSTDVDAMVSKPFPTNLQKQMMGKQWNDIVWPLIHMGFALFIAVWVLNAFGGIGPLAVDGTGGPVELDMKGQLLHPDGLVNGDSYSCNPEYQVGDCKNSLTPLAGDSSSMPAGFYWDGILFMVLGVIGLAGSLFAHLAIMSSWRSRAKAMKEVEDDTTDASSEAEADEVTSESEDDDLDDDLEEEMDEALGDDIDEESLDSEIDEDTEQEADESIDVGSHVGLTLDDEEVYGTIIEFDDDDETVTIEEDKSGDIITGYQSDMFLE